MSFSHEELDDQQPTFTSFQQLTEQKEKKQKSAVNSIHLSTKLESQSKQPYNTMPIRNSENPERTIIDLRKHIYLTQNIRYDGKIEWTINNISHHIREAHHNHDWQIYSPHAYQGPQGIKFGLTLFPVGTEKTFAQYSSINFYIMKGSSDEHVDWPFKGKITISLINGDLKHTNTFLTNPCQTSFQRPTTPTNMPYSLHKFLPLSKLKEYIYEDNIHLECEVEAITESPFDNIRLSTPENAKIPDWIITDHRPQLSTTEELEYLSRRKGEDPRKNEWRTPLQLNDKHVTVEYLALTHIAQSENITSTPYMRQKANNLHPSIIRYFSILSIITIVLAAQTIPKSDARVPDYSPCNPYHTLNHNTTSMLSCLNNSTSKTCVTTQIFAPPITPITVYKCSHTQETNGLFSRDLTHIRVSRKQCKQAITTGTFNGQLLTQLPNSSIWEAKTQHPWLTLTPNSNFTVYRYNALLLGPTPLLEQSFIKRKCHYHTYRCRPTPNSTDIWIWLRKKIPQDNYKYLGTKSAILANNETIIIPTLQMITKVITPHRPDLTGTNGYYFSKIRETNCTFPLLQ